MAYVYGKRMTSAYECIVRYASGITDRIYSAEEMLNFYFRRPN